MEIKKRIIPILSIESLLALDAIFAIQPFFLWRTYSYEWFFDSLKIIIELMIMAKFCLHTNLKYSMISFISVLSFCVCYFYYTFNVYDNAINLTIGIFSKVIIMSIFLLLPKRKKALVFEFFSVIFVISLIPGLIVFCCNLIGLDLPNNVIEANQIIKVNGNQQYRHYFGCVFRENKYYIQGFKQLCGIYDEPGQVGTICGFLLVAKKFDIKGDKKNIILLVAGVASVSLAFFLICFIYFTIAVFMGENRRKFYILIGGLLLGIMLVFLASRNDFFRSNVLKRLSIYNLINNNRTSDSFDILYHDFWRDGNFRNLIFGFGNNNPTFNTVDVASYKLLIYNTGILGFALIIGWFVFWSFKFAGANKDAIILNVLFLISIYQRPWIVNLYSLVILIGGIYYLKSNMIINMSSRDKEDVKVCIKTFRPYKMKNEEEHRESD